MILIPPPEQKPAPGTLLDYDKHQWTSHLFDIEGSMVREITGRVSACVLWAVAVVAFHYLVFKVNASSSVHALVGAALGLLLVFRTNASYDRFWEGRKMWGGMLNEARNLARGVRAYVVPGAPDLAEPIALWAWAFPHAVMNGLRNTAGLGPAEMTLPRDEVDAVSQAPHPPTAVATRISRHLVEARNRGVISDYVLTYLDQNVQQFIDYLGACERIKKTPLPFAYVVHLRRALILYNFTLPLVLVETYGWWTVLVTLLTAYTFFGIEEIGVEIENPFGHDSNDLPLEKFCEGIGRDVFGTLCLPDPTAPAAPNNGDADADDGRGAAATAPARV